jgi:hypothetical protein
MKLETRYSQGPRSTNKIYEIIIVVEYVPDLSRKQT